jgi:DNA uptake protein ComE-like DNA-binding protein
MRTTIVLSALTLATLARGCNTNSQPTPDQIRHDTAAATATVAGDIKGAAEGLRDGLHQEVHSSTSSTVNINTASRPDLETLPGVDPVVANLIIHHRPYGSTNDLVKKHVLTRGQFDQLSSRVSTN